jgi:hypothetical protein
MSYIHIRRREISLPCFSFNSGDKHDHYQPEQEYNDIHWGTGIPVVLKVGEQFVQVWARGSCSLMVRDRLQLQPRVPNPEDLPGFVRSLLASLIEETIGELGMQVSKVAQLTVVTDQMVQSFQAKIESKFAELGLKLKAISIDAIESI